MLMVLYLQTASLATLGGNSLADTVRRIIRKLGTNSLWSHYSLKGRKGKIPLIGLPIVRLVISVFHTMFLLLSMHNIVQNKDYVVFMTKYA